MTAIRDVLKREIKVLAFDQYGTIVDMQKGLTRGGDAFLEDRRAGTASRTVSSPGGGARISRTR